MGGFNVNWGCSVTVNFAETFSFDGRTLMENSIKKSFTEIQQARNATREAEFY